MGLKLAHFQQLLGKEEVVPPSQYMPFGLPQISLQTQDFRTDFTERQHRDPGTLLPFGECDNLTNVVILFVTSANSILGLLRLKPFGGRVCAARPHSGRPPS